MEKYDAAFPHGRKMTAAICVLIMVMSLASCMFPEDKVAASLGAYENSVFYTSGGFQDYTDYGKYFYTNADLAGNKYLKQIRESDMGTIEKHLDDFEGWIEVIGNGEPSSEVVVYYDFDRTIIDMEDYFYIESEERTWNDGHTTLVNYDVYFFDVQSQVLYYFHNNI